MANNGTLDLEGGLLNEVLCKLIILIIYDEPGVPSCTIVSVVTPTVHLIQQNNSDDIF